MNITDWITMAKNNKLREEINQVMDLLMSTDIKEGPIVFVSSMELQRNVTEFSQNSKNLNSISY